MMGLVHYSDTPLEEVVDAPFQVEGRKPVGLWFSNENKDGWRSWCKDQDFRQDQFNYKTTVKFKPDANILQLTNKRSVRNFQMKYGKPDDPYFPLNWKVDWPTVAKQYDAIYFPSYHNELRNDYRWYDSFDCASGCVWNAKAIESIETVPVEKPPEEYPYDAHIQDLNEYRLAA
jgi:hypothetical protein